MLQTNMLVGLSISLFLSSFSFVVILGSWEGDAPIHSSDTEGEEFCDNFSVDGSVLIESLPSEIPTLKCRCWGTTRRQACPQWTFLDGFGNASVARNETERDEFSCAAFLKFNVKSEVLPYWKSYLFNLRCIAPEHKKDSTLFVKKSYQESRCTEDQDCLWINQKCEIRGSCRDGQCPKFCHCVEPTSIFVEKSLETCYSSSAFGERCSYTDQCHSNMSSRFVCSQTETNQSLSTTGVCECPEGFSFDELNQLCLLTVPETPHQTVTERIIIAVCCGIIGVCIFLFVSYLCKRNCARSVRRQSANDFSKAPDSTLPLNVPVEKPPPYQESAETDTEVAEQQKEAESKPDSSSPSLKTNSTDSNSFAVKVETEPSQESPV